MRDSEGNFCVADEGSGGLDKTAEESQIFRVTCDLISVVDRRHIDSSDERETRGTVPSDKQGVISQAQSIL